MVVRRGDKFVGQVEWCELKAKNWYMVGDWRIATGVG